MTDAAHAAPRDVLLHMTDIHFWEIVRNPLQLMNKRFLGNLNVILRRRRAFDTTQAAAFADALAATGARVVFAGGDFTSTATDGEFRQALAFMKELTQRGLQVIALPGNHDVYTFESARRRRFERHFASFIPEEGYPCRVTLPGGTPLVLAPTVCPNWISSCGRIAEPDVARIAELIAEAPPGPLIVGSHYPVLHATEGYASGRTRRLRNADALRRVLMDAAAQRPICFLAGHVHRFSAQQDPRQPRLRHFTTAALFQHRHDGAAGAFSEIHAGAEGFTVFQHTRRDGAWQRRPAG